MKIILAGSTGFIGREVLQQCIKNSTITSIVALSRSELPVKDPKLEAVILKDFLAYNDSVLEATKDADACIWSIGKPYIHNHDEAKKISIDYTLAAVKAFTPASSDRKFRFVYVSGIAAEKDQTKPLWYMQDYRRIRGQLENELLLHAKQHENFETVIMRPGLVLAENKGFRELLRFISPHVGLDALVTHMVHSALNGNKDQLVDNPVIGQF